MSLKGEEKELEKRLGRKVTCKRTNVLDLREICKRDWDVTILWGKKWSTKVSL